MGQQMLSVLLLWWCCSSHRCFLFLFVFDTVEWYQVYQTNFLRSWAEFSIIITKFNLCGHIPCLTTSESCFIQEWTLYFWYFWPVFCRSMFIVRGRQKFLAQYLPDLRALLLLQDPATETLLLPNMFRPLIDLCLLNSKLLQSLHHIHLQVCWPVQRHNSIRRRKILCFAGK